MQATVREHMACSAVPGSECVRDKIKMTISGWNKTNELLEANGAGCSKQTAPVCQMTFSKPEKKNTAKYVPEGGLLSY